MGGRGSKSTVTSGGGGGILQNAAQYQINQEPPQQVSTATQATQANNQNFPDTDSSPFHQLYNGAGYFQSQTMTADQVWATLEYLRDDTGNADSWSTKGTAAQNASQSPLHSMAQNMNNLMVYNAQNGLPLTSGMSANQMFTHKHLMGAMHNLGQNLNLTRYDHPRFLNRILAEAGLGPNVDYSRMSLSQLQQVLVGRIYNEGKFLSTSYNNFAKIRNDPNIDNTFLHRAVRIEYKSKASTQAFMPGKAPRRDFGEVVLSPDTNGKIVGVRFDNSVKVRKQGSAGLSNLPQLVLTVETE